ncbi:MAG: PH domain-containing protein [Micrococcus sp.]|nr:PH domain-containing protein [Micrococcus sp.]
MPRAFEATTPDADASAPLRLPAAVRPYWTLRSIVTPVILIPIVLVIAHVWGSELAFILQWIALGLILLGAAVELGILNRIAYRYYAYGVSKDAVDIRRGKFVRQSMTVAVPQILRVHITQGPLERMFGLASLRCHCIVEGETVGPLTLEEAERVKAVVLAGIDPERDT